MNTAVSCSLCYSGNESVSESPGHRESVPALCQAGRSGAGPERVMNAMERNSQGLTQLGFRLVTEFCCRIEPAVLKAQDAVIAERQTALQGHLPCVEPDFGRDAANVDVLRCTRFWRYRDSGHRSWHSGHDGELGRRCSASSIANQSSSIFMRYSNPWRASRSLVESHSSLTGNSLA